MMIEQVRKQLSVTKDIKSDFPSEALIESYLLFSHASLSADNCQAFLRIFHQVMDDEKLHGNPSLIANFHQNLGRIVGAKSFSKHISSTLKAKSYTLG